MGVSQHYEIHKERVIYIKKQLTSTISHEEQDVAL